MRAPEVRPGPDKATPAAGMTVDGRARFAEGDHWLTLEPEFCAGCCCERPLGFERPGPCEEFDERPPGIIDDWGRCKEVEDREAIEAGWTWKFEAGLEGD